MTRRARDTIRRFAGPAIVVLVFVVMAAWTWGTWPDPIVDFGREIYLPWQIAQGKVLYRDLPHFNGPLSAYFNALIFKLTGPGLRSLALANLAILAALTALIYRLFSRIACRFAATVACLTLLSVFGFLRLTAVGNYNFVTPYSHELTHGVVLTFAALICLNAYLSSARRRWIIAAGILLGLVFLTKIEVFLAASIGTGLGAALAILRTEFTLRTRLSAACGFASAFLAIPLTAMLLLSTQVASSWRYVLDPRITGLRFYDRAFGSIDAYESVQALILQAAIATAFVLVAAWIARRRSVIAPLISAAALIAFYCFVPMAWERAFRGTAVLTLTVVIALAAATLRERSPQRIVQLATATFALVLLAKIALNVRAQHYGFALAMPGFLVLIAAVLSWIPRWIDSRGGSGTTFRMMALPPIGLFVFIHLSAYARVFSNQPHIVGSGADQFRSDLRGASVNRVVSYLGSLDPQATLAVIPEGAMINYLSRRENPTGYVNLMPPEVLMFGQDRIIERFRQHPPDYVLVVETRPYDYGYRVFENYARDVDAYVRANYSPVVDERFPRDLNPPMTLLRRRAREQSTTTPTDPADDDRPR